MVITQKRDLVKNKTSRCDNPLGGIHNPYQITKEFAYLAFLFPHYTLLLLPHNKMLYEITTAAAD